MRLSTSITLALAAAAAALPVLAAPADDLVARARKGGKGQKCGKGDGIVRHSRSGGCPGLPNHLHGRDLFDEFAVRDITPDLEAGESVELEARGLHGSGQRGRPQRSGGHNSHMKGPSGRGHGPARHRKSPNHRYALDVVLPYLSADKSLQERIR
ncbi:hypothetical protein NLI96_g13005 [Meripilus lineatus]|uniref:Uncharacterized protein n=1 Tax=Meripilus lineatus TaxID=2056292 RepID=A0AAD5UNS8_9APHY|nr:hypothetical protein NLI96_g13005 [Physisporinus lineatus]